MEAAVMVAHQVVVLTEQPIQVAGAAAVELLLVTLSAAVALAALAWSLFPCQQPITLV